MRPALHYLLCGLAMGAADVVPGVSGGTIAYITGIYDRLLSSIKSFDSTFFRQILTFHIREAFSRIPWSFLLPLLCGIVISIVSLAKLTLHLLHTYPEALWAFFFGLIVSSIVMLAKGHSFSAKNIVLMLLGASGAWFLAGADSMTASHTLPNIFIAGFIALCAMILPGISGSFILVLMGQYSYILSSLVQGKLDVILVFLAGGLCGLMSFSRLLSASFRRFPSETNAVLIGVMAGCLRTVWPWHEGNMPILPHQSDSTVLLALAACAGGVALPLLLQKWAQRKQATQ